MSRYPFDLTALCEELRAVRISLGEQGSLIEKQLDLAAWTANDIESGSLDPEASAFRDYAEHLETQALINDIALSDNFNRYRTWEDNGWVMSRDRHALAIDILEKQVSILGMAGVPSQSDTEDGSGMIFESMKSIQESISILRKDAAERQGLL